MTNVKLTVPTVYPTQSWEIHNTTDWSGARYSSPNGAAALKDYAYIYFRDNDDIIFCQEILLTMYSDQDTPWSIIPQGAPAKIFDTNRVPLLSQAPVSVAEIEGQIYIFLNEYSGSNTTHIYKTRYITTNEKAFYAPIVQQFPGEYMIKFSAPAIGYNSLAAAESLDSSIMLLWAGGANNGYFFSLGNIKKNADQYGDDIEFLADNNGNVITGTVPGTRL